MHLDYLKPLGLRFMTVLSEFLSLIEAKPLIGCNRWGGGISMYFSRPRLFNPTLARVSVRRIVFLIVMIDHLYRACLAVRYTWVRVISENWLWCENCVYGIFLGQMPRNTPHPPIFGLVSEWVKSNSIRFGEEFYQSTWLIMTPTRVPHQGIVLIHLFMKRW